MVIIRTITVNDYNKNSINLRILAFDHCAYRNAGYADWLINLGSASADLGAVYGLGKNMETLIQS